MHHFFRNLWSGIQRLEARYFLPVLWYTLAAFLIVWAVLYLSVQALRQPLSLLWFVVAFLIVFSMMFFGEGTEIAYTTLMDKDPEQFPADLKARFEKLIASEHVSFISGRQLIVVLAIVGMTWLCEILSDVEDANVKWFSAQSIATLWKFHHPFSIVFPAFFAFWFAQLPSKLIAHESALMAYRWSPIRWAIAWSIFLGNNLRVQGPSPQVKDFVVRFLRRDGEILRPSRASLYKNAVLLRDGKGLEKVHIKMFIGYGGAIEIYETISMHAYGPGVTTAEQTTHWEAEVDRDEGASVKPSLHVECPVTYAQYGPNFSGPIEIDGKVYYKVEWRVRLTQKLPVGNDLALRVEYATKTGAMKSTVGDKDYYQYTVLYVPTHQVTVEVTARSNAGFMLIDAKVDAKTSEDDGVNNDEGSRVKISNIPGGYCFHVEYPLLNTQFKFGWTVGPSAYTLAPGPKQVAAAPSQGILPPGPSAPLPLPSGKEHGSNAAQ